MEKIKGVNKEHKNKNSIYVDEDLRRNIVNYHCRKEKIVFFREQAMGHLINKPRLHCIAGSDGKSGRE